MATRLTETTLNEGLAASAVDEEAGVIKPAKLLGRVSKNGREYSPEAMRQAAGLYEGAKVNIDHRARHANADRSFTEGCGELRNCRVEGDGVFGEFHFLKSHPAAGMIVESAKRFPKQFGFSHDAEGETVVRGGKTLVESISAVHSVDIVGRPATNKGIFESEDTDQMSKPKTRTVSKILEAAKDGPFKARLARLVEMEAIAADMPVETAAEADPAEEVKAALEKAAVAVIKKLFAGDIEQAAAFAEIKKILGMKEDAAGDDTATTTPPEVQESVQKLESRLNLMEAENAILKAGRESTPARAKAVASLSGAERKELIESFPAKDGGKPAPSDRPGFRTGSILESQDGSGRDSLKEIFGDDGPGYRKYAKKA